MGIGDRHRLPRPIYESDGLGVGPNDNPSANVRMRGTERFHLAMILGANVQFARLLRHPDDLLHGLQISARPTAMPGRAAHQSTYGVSLIGLPSLTTARFACFQWSG